MGICLVCQQSVPMSTAAPEAGKASQFKGSEPCCLMARDHGRNSHKKYLGSLKPRLMRVQNAFQRHWQR